MFVVGLVYDVLALLDGLLAAFVGHPVFSFVQLADGEWTMTGGTLPTVTGKGNALLGAVADIVTYGAILVDWMVQALLNAGAATAINAATTP